MYHTKRLLCSYIVSIINISPFIILYKNPSLYVCVLPFLFIYILFYENIRREYKQIKQKSTNAI